MDMHIAQCHFVEPFLYQNKVRIYDVHMRKRLLDQDVDDTAPAAAAGSKSISWTAPMLFVMGIYFFCGYLMGSWSLSVIVVLCTDQAAIPWTRLLMNHVGAGFLVVSWIIIKSFDWEEHNEAGEEYEEEETMPLYVPMIDPVLL
jgi:hypothetical protein